MSLFKDYDTDEGQDLLLYSPVVGVFTVPQTDVPKKDKNQSKTYVMPKPALQQVRYLRENCKLISVVVIYRLVKTPTGGTTRAMSLFKDYDPDESHDLLHY